MLEVKSVRIRASALLLSDDYCLLRLSGNSALFGQAGKPAAVNSSLIAEVDEFHMCVRVQLVNIKNPGLEPPGRRKRNSP